MGFIEVWNHISENLVQTIEQCISFIKIIRFECFNSQSVIIYGLKSKVFPCLKLTGSLTLAEDGQILNNCERILSKSKGSVLIFEV